MKYTEKFGNGFLTFEHEDLKRISFSLFNIVLYLMTIIIGFCLCLLLFGLSATLLGWILNFLS